MNMERLLKYTQKPPVFTKGTAEMWVDDYISQHLLETHLNPDIDLASRKGSTISKTVAWILDQVSGDKLSILDLGCGPGLYTEQLAEKGHHVTGMDYSQTSIDYAKESSRKKRLDLTYVHQNYLTLQEEDKYDLVYMIFTDFGVLTPAERTVLLENVYRALKPGGRFIFDVLNDTFLEKAGKKEWQLAESGFWRDKPYLALSDFFLYDEEKVILNQHVIVEESGRIDVYRFWNRGFSHDDLENIVTETGFEKTSCHDDLLADSEMYHSRDVTFCITNKPL